MINKNCLNCGKELTDKYCSRCGQKADTHRISFKHFITHDVLHGTFHIEKGMLFTAKEALIRPGKAALDYISGKRVNYYNVFYFILLLMGFNILLTHYYNEIAFHLDPDKAIVLQTDAAGKKLGQIFSKYGKIFTFALVPVLALNSFLIFKRRKFNYSEHFIISGMLLLGFFILTSLFLLFSFTEFTGLSSKTVHFIQNLLPYITLIYIIWCYFNAFRKDYSLLGFSYRMLSFLMLLSAEIFLFIWILVGIATDWTKEASIEFTF